VIEQKSIVSFVSRELSATSSEAAAAAAAGDKKKKRKNEKKVENVTLSGLQGVHNLENAVMMMVAMGYREEDCLRVLPTVHNDVNLAVEELSKDERSGSGGGGSGGGGGGSGGGGGGGGGEGKESEKMSRSESGEGKSESSGGKTLEIELPAGLDPGMEIAVQDPETGKQHTIIVPDNYTPGVKMNVDI